LVKKKRWSILLEREKKVEKAGELGPQRTPGPPPSRRIEVEKKKVFEKG